jgi:protease IV
MAKRSRWPWIFCGTLFFFFCLGIFFVGLSMALIGGNFPLWGDVAVVPIEGELYHPQPIIDQLEDLAERDDVRAVIVRIDSPGGTVSASQEIYHAIVRLRAVKPVVASLGTVAASGGYYAACGATKILANEGTITGSIGVRMNHVNVAKVFEWAMVKPRVLASGKYKDIGSPLRDLRADEEQMLMDVLRRMHQQFKSVVEKERAIDAKKLAELADGRIFTGDHAQELGLVDQVGTLQDAADVAAKLAGLTEKPRVFFMKPKEESWTKYLSESIIGHLRAGLTEAVRPQSLVLWQL